MRKKLDILLEVGDKARAVCAVQEMCGAKVMTIFTKRKVLREEDGSAGERKELLEWPADVFLPGSRRL